MNSSFYHGGAMNDQNVYHYMTWILQLCGTVFNEINTSIIILRLIHVYHASVAK